MTMPVVDTPGTANGPRIVHANRRSFPRVGASELRWLQRVRLSRAGTVSLINLSVRGALFELGARVYPGDSAELEFVADGDRTIASGRIVRSEIADLGADTLRYRGACVFAAPLAWARKLPVAPPVPDMPTIASDATFEAWWGWTEALLVFRHSKRLRGFVRGFNPAAATVDVFPTMTASASSRQTVPLGLLRAIQFVRDFDDAGAHVDALAAEAHAFPEVHVVFRNGDIIRGMLPSYDPERSGFWLLPAVSTLARRVFAVASAVAEIRVF